MPQNPMSWFVTVMVLPSLRPQYFIFLLHKLERVTNVSTWYLETVSCSPAFPNPKPKLWFRGG